MVKIEKRQSSSVQDSVYTALRRSIINMNLEPGTAVSEKDISVHFKVSRTPVREAFIHLSQEGLVKVIPQKETMVSLIDLRRVEQEFFIRENLEMAALGLFSAAGGGAEFARLNLLLEQQGQALDSKDYIGFINYDDAFHHVFFEASGQDLAWNVLESLCGHYHRMRFLTIRVGDIARNIILQHRRMVDCLAQGRLEDAREILKGHLHKLFPETNLLREEFPHYFAAGPEEDAFTADFGNGGKGRTGSESTL